MHLQMRLPLLALCLLTTTYLTTLSAQITAGPDPNSNNNCIPTAITMSYNGDVNGRSAYLYSDGQVEYVVFWTGARWEFWLQYIIIMSWCEQDTQEPPCSNIFPWQIDVGCDFQTAPYIQGNCSSAPLPLELLDFEVRGTPSAVSLHWTTALERASTHISIQRSDDLSHWTTIGTMPLAGNSHSPLHYTYTDDQPPSLPVLHYRLMWAEPDGQVHFSLIRSVHISTLAHLKLVPNPAHTFTTLVCTSQCPEEARIWVYSAEGQCCLEVMWWPGQSDIDLSRLPSGLYSIQVSIPNAPQQVLRLVVQHTP